MSHTTKRHAIPFLLLTAAVLFTLYAFSESLRTVRYTVAHEKIHTPVRIVLIADLHSCTYGEKQDTLLRAIRKAEPDLICLAGDIFDDVTPHQGAMELLDGIADDYPCYFVTGNHEHWSDEVTVLYALMASYGVTVLAGDAVCCTVNGQTLLIAGVDDPTGFHDPGTYGVPDRGSWYGQLALAEKAAADSPAFSILLSHRPEKAEEYAASSFDLILSGHAHGGQLRIPFLLNGFFAPNQGYFPPYAGGRYTWDDTTMIVSRGLCRNDLPRLFNRPELVMIDLQPQT